MNKEEIEEIETLEIDFKDTDELKLALEVSSKKAIYLIDDLINYLFELQQENKQLKDNWNKLKDYIVREYYLFIPLNASTSCITKLIEKMQELEGKSE